MSEPKLNGSGVYLPFVTFVAGLSLLATLYVTTQVQAVEGRLSAALAASRLEAAEARRVDIERVNERLIQFSRDLPR